MDGSRKDGALPEGEAASMLDLEDSAGEVGVGGSLLGAAMAADGCILRWSLCDNGSSLKSSGKTEVWLNAQSKVSLLGLRTWTPM